MIARVTKALEKKEKGFTLIELLVVVIIIGILAAIAIPVYLNQQNSAKDSEVKSDLANAKTAVIAYAIDFPADTAVAIPGDIATGYGFTDGANTTFTTTSVDTTAAWTIVATSTTGKTFQVASDGGVTEVVAIP